MKKSNNIWHLPLKVRSETGLFRIFIFLFLFISFLQKEAVGQQGNLILKQNRFGLEEGLSGTTMSTPYMDSHGLIWIGQQLGIDRFDGNKVEHFAYSEYFPDLGSFYEIIEDASGQFWVLGTSANSLEQRVLYLFDLDKRESLAMAHFPTPLPFKPEEVLMIKGTKARDQVWIITAHKVYRATSAEDVRLVFESGIDINAAIANHNSIWLQTNTGFIKLDQEGSPIKQLPFAQKGVYFMVGEDSESNLFYSRIRPDNGETKVQIFKNEKEWQPGFWKDKRFWAINPVDDQIWIRDFKEDQTQIRSLDLELLYTIADDEITYSDPFYLGFDLNGRAWRNFDSQLHMYQFEPSFFKNYLTDIDIYGRVGFGTRGIGYINDSTLLVSGLAGTALLNLNTGQYRLLKEPAHIEPFTNLFSTRRLDAINGPDGKIWLSSETDQILSYDPANGSYEAVHREGKIYNEASGEYEEALDLNWALHIDKSGVMWIGQQLGLAHRQPGSKAYFEYEDYGDYPELEQAKITDFYENDQGLWIAASSGLYLMTEQQKLVRRYHKEGARGFQIPFNNITQITEGADNSLWLATIGAGIINLKPETGQWRQWTTKDGLSHDVTYAAYPDAYGKVWIPSNRGINKLDLASGTFSTYTTLDGISHNEFNTTSHARLPDGRLAFGGINGLVLVNPKDFERENEQQLLTITGLSIQSRRNGEFYDAFPSFSEETEIRLAPADIAFVLSFSMLDFMPEGANQTAYMVEGLDANWNFVDQSEIRFNRLPYGRHTLKVKSQGLNGTWSKELLISIKVLRPIYQQWWFLLALLIILLTSIRLLVNKREKRLKERQLELEAQVQQRTEKIKKQADELQSLDKLKSSFFANISHELKTPLTLISAPIKSVLANSELDSSNKEDLLLADRNVKTIQNLINEILDLNRLESGITQPRYAQIDVNQFFKLIYQNFTPKARALKISYQLTSDVPQGKSWVVDPIMTEKIVNNLISNAFKHVEAGGKVTLLVIIGTELIVRVKDNGKGISEEDLPFIFDRYFQTKDPGKKAEGGTGIGLALSNELAQVMNGQLQVESTLNIGSEFTLRLPQAVATETIWEAEEVEALADTSPEIFSELQSIRPRLLLVEDQEEMIQFIRKNLSALFDLTTAGNGADALEKLKGGLQVDLIISDMMMPMMDGMDLLRHVRATPELKDIPMIFLTAKSAERDKMEAFRLGIDDYLIKPFLMDELKARIKNQLKVAQSDREASASALADEEVTDQLAAKWLKAVRLTTEENADKPDFNLDSVAQKVGESKRTFSRKLKRYTGYSPGVYLKEIRLQMARKGLENGVHLRVNDAARAVGFSSTKYFARQYKERFGKYPSDYLK